MANIKRWIGVQQEVLYATYTDLVSVNTDKVGFPTKILVTISPASTYFAVGMNIRIEDDVTSEFNTIAALPGLTEITLGTALTNDYTVVANAKVTIMPLKYMPYRTMDVQPGQNPLAIEESDERMKTGYMYGGFVGSGPLVLTGRPDNIGWFLKWGMGAAAVGASVNASLLAVNAASGQKDCTVAAGAGFAEGDTVKISDDNASEFNEIATILGNVLTMTTNLAATYTVVANGVVEVNVWKHRYTMGETVKSFLMEECVGISGQLGRFLVGNVIKRITIESTMGSPLLFTIELQNNHEILLTQSTIGSLPSIRGFALHDAVATLVAAVKAESIRINIENTSPDDAFVSNSRMLPDISLEGFSINGECEIRFEDWAERQLFYGALAAGVEPTEPQEEVRLHALSAIWTGPPTGDPTQANYRLDVNLPSVLLTENPLATAGRDRLKQRFTFEAVYHASNYIDLYNKVESYDGIV